MINRGSYYKLVKFEVPCRFSVYIRIPSKDRESAMSPSFRLWCGVSTMAWWEDFLHLDARLRERVAPSHCSPTGEQVPCLLQSLPVLARHDAEKAPHPLCMRPMRKHTTWT
ncbi:hypothetical protein BDN71DRAFT_1277572 [Pleurotus eryngii]|uniref:Uncharacterized protein n=1 Tax=Pleurotus eryngii TaxID=5323 RepID=A0A9P5ZP18_PLEER|nr:hypothetical protein BDN71DRAFT_1277572 [Pleurotus eryngii]